jgi:hypothetical protein
MAGAQRSAPTAPIAAPASDDTLLGVKGGLIKRFAVSNFVASSAMASYQTKASGDTSRMDLDFGAPKVTISNAFAGNIFNGAVWADGSTSASGITIPVGVTGRQSFYNAPFTFTKARAKALTGKTVRFFVWFEISSGALSARTWALNKLVQQQTGSAGALGTITNERFEALADGARALLSWDITFGGDEANVQVSIQTTLSSTATVESTVKPISQHYVLAKNGDSFQDALENSARTEVRYIDTIVVKPDGTGDYTTLKAAITAEGGGVSLMQRLLYQVHEGVYTDVSHTLPTFADVTGIGKRENIWFKGELAASEALATITATSTFDMNFTNKLKNIKVTCKNMRYPIHSDSSASSNRALQEVDDCHIEHLGNDEARAYQTGIGGNPGGVWTEEQAWGCGTHSGQRILSKRTRWVGPKSPFGFHTNKDFAEPCYVELDQCQVINPTGGVAMGCSPYGSGTPDRFVVKDCEIQGTFLANAGSWLSLALANARGSRISECEVFITGSSPVAAVSTNTCNVLELRSIDSASSAVSVSGTGATAIFGSQPVYIDGGVGYPARVYSNHAITGPATGIGLGARLGDCSSVNKTLTVAFDGGASADLVLADNYTAMTNAQVVTALNTLLADGTRSFYEIDPYDETGPIFQPDRERRLKNNGATAILKGMAVAFDGSNVLGRIATSADARTLIAGIALENIVAGKVGRILKSGHIHQNAVLFNGAVSLAYGDTFGVSSTAGKLVEAGAVPMLRYVNTSVLEFV